MLACTLYQELADITRHRFVEVIRIYNIPTHSRHPSLETMMAGSAPLPQLALLMAAGDTILPSSDRVTWEKWARKALALPFAKPIWSTPEEKRL